MDKKKRVFVVLTIVCTLSSVGLIVAAFATDNWIKGNAELANTNQTATNKTNTNNKAFAWISFGLFRGERTIDYSLSPRPQIITVRCSNPYCLIDNEPSLYQGNSENKLQEIINNYETVKRNNSDVKMYNYGLFPFAFWISTIVLMALGATFGLVYIGFAFFNVFGKPIETITGPLGLYVWNMLALLFSLSAMIVYLVLYIYYYKFSILPKEDINAGFVSKATLDYSFYLLVAGVSCSFLNILLLIMSGLKMRCGCMQEAEKIMDNGIILY